MHDDAPDDDDDPIGQGVQDDAPDDDDDPSRQSVHDADPSALEYDPAEHDWHSDPAEEE